MWFFAGSIFAYVLCYQGFLLFWRLAKIQASFFPEGITLLMLVECILFVVSLLMANKFREDNPSFSKGILIGALGVLIYVLGGFPFR